MSLYTDAVAHGIPTANHESDLYLPATAQARALVEANGLHATTFVNNLDGQLWLDVPFAFDPWWEARTP